MMSYNMEDLYFTSIVLFSVHIYFVSTYQGGIQICIWICTWMQILFIFVMEIKKVHVFDIWSV